MLDRNTQPSLLDGSSAQCRSRPCVLRRVRHRRPIDHDLLDRSIRSPDHPSDLCMRAWCDASSRGALAERSLPSTHTHEHIQATRRSIKRQRNQQPYIGLGQACLASSEPLKTSHAKHTGRKHADDNPTAPVAPTQHTR